MIQLPKRSDQNNPSESTTDAASPFSAELVKTKLILFGIIFSSALFAFYTIVDLLLTTDRIPMLIHGTGAILAVANALYYLKTKNRIVSTQVLMILLLAVLAALLQIRQNDHLTIVWTIGYPVAAYLFLKREQADYLNIIYISGLLIYLVLNYQDWDAAQFDEGSIANLMIFLVTIALLLRYYNKILNDAAESLKQKNSELERLSITDKLTGLYNRTKIDQSLSYELSQYIRSGQSFAVILGDVDHFKAINDHLGHQKGDQALVHLAQILQTEIRSIDMLGRWGGEEFVIIFPNTEATEALALANRLREQLKVHAHPELGWIKMSFGISGSLPGDTVDSILQRSDRALYQAKTEGRDRAIMAQT